MASPGQARPSLAWPGQARPGQAWPGLARLAWLGQARPGLSKPGPAMPGQAILWCVILCLELFLPALSGTWPYDFSPDLLHAAMRIGKLRYTPKRLRTSMH